MLMFIYGTLKRSERNHSVISGLNGKFITTTETVDKYPMVLEREPFPYLFEEPGIGERISGEIFDIPEKHLNRLDQFEGSPELYYRGTVVVTLNGENALVGVYFASHKRRNKNFLRNYNG